MKKISQILNPEQMLTYKLLNIACSSAQIQSINILIEAAYQKGIEDSSKESKEVILDINKTELEQQ